jgi:hypothetical protein
MDKLVSTNALNKLAKSLDSRVKKLFEDEKSRAMLIEQDLDNRIKLLEAFSNLFNMNDCSLWIGTQNDFEKVNNIRQDTFYVSLFEYNTELGFDTGEIVFDNSIEQELVMSSVSASYTGGQVPVGSTVSSLLSNLTVTAWYNNGTNKMIKDYTIVEGTDTTIVEGVNTFTVSYQGKTATFTVSGEILSIDTLAVVYDGGNQVYGAITVDDLRQYINVTVYYTNGTKDENITDYEILGELVKGLNTLTVSYGDKTTNFEVYLEVKSFTITINPVPYEGSVIKINGVETNWVNAESGSTITYEVSNPGYITQTGEVIVVGSETITVTLVKISEYTITYVYRNMKGADIKDSTSEVVLGETLKTFSTSDAPIIDGYTIYSVSPSEAIINEDLTVIYTYSKDEVVEEGDIVWYTNMAEESPRNETAGAWTGAYFYSEPETIALYVGKPINMIKLQPASAGKLSYGYYSETEFVSLGYITLEGASDTLVEYRVSEFTLQEGQNFWIFKNSGDSGSFKCGSNKVIEGATYRRKLTGPAKPGTGEGSSGNYQSSLGVDLGFSTTIIDDDGQLDNGWYTEFSMVGTPNTQIYTNQGVLAYTNPDTLKLYVGKPINRLRFMTENAGNINYGKFKYDSEGIPTELTTLGTIYSSGKTNVPVEYAIETFTLQEGENFWIFDSTGGSDNACLRICTGTSNGNSEFNANIRVGSKGNTLHGGGSNLLVDFGYQE